MAVAAPTTLEWQVTYPPEWMSFRGDPAHPEDPTLLEAVSQNLARVVGGRAITEGLLRWALSSALTGDQAFDAAAIGMHTVAGGDDSLLVVALAGYQDKLRLTDLDSDRVVQFTRTWFGWDADDAAIESIALPAGPALRLNMFVGTSASAAPSANANANDSNAYQTTTQIEPRPSAFVTMYAIDPPGRSGSIWLVFVTPNWTLAPQLLELFGAIAETVEVVDDDATTDGRRER